MTIHIAMERIICTVGDGVATLQIHDAAERATALSDVPLSVLQRSTLLASNLDEETAHGSSEFIIACPAGYLQSWLDGVEALKSSCYTDVSSTTISFIKAADYFDDGVAFDELCTFLSSRLFATCGSPTHERACKVSIVNSSLLVLQELPEGVVVRVLQSCPFSLEVQLACLPQPFHIAALHASFPSILKDASLDLDCTQYSLGTAIAAVKLLTLHCKGETCLQSLNLTLPWRLWRDQSYDSPLGIEYFEALKDLAAIGLRSVRVSLKGEVSLDSDVPSDACTDVLRDIVGGGCCLKDADFTCKWVEPQCWDDEMWEALCHHTSLTSLYLGLHARITRSDERCGHSLSMLSALTGLRTLSLRIQVPSDIISVAEVLRALPHLQDFRLNGEDSEESSFRGESCSLDLLGRAREAYAEIASQVTGLTRLEYPSRISALSRVFPICVKDDFLWPWLSHLPGLKRLDVSSKCSQVNTDSRLQVIMPHLTALEDLRVRVGQYQPLLGVLGHLSRLCHLTKLVLNLGSGPGGYNGTQSLNDGVRLCAALHQLQTLRHLELRSIHQFFKWDGHERLREILAACPHSGFSALTHLECLGVFPFAAEKQLCGLDFSACQHLQTLRLLHCGERSKSGAPAILENLKSLRNLQSVCIDGYASATP